MEYIIWSIIIITVVFIMIYIDSPVKKEKLNSNESIDKVNKEKKKALPIIEKYRMKENYITSEYVINNILSKINDSPYKTIQYIGYADKNLILSLKDKYELIIFDWFDRTNAGLHYWEGDDKEFCSQFPIPEWAKNLTYATGMGVTEHEVLLLDMPLEFDLEDGLKSSIREKKLPRLILLFGDADSNAFPNKYTWTFEDIWTGRIIED